VVTLPLPDLLRTLEGMGVKLSPEGDNLRLKGHQQPLSSELRAAVLVHKLQLLDLLRARQAGTAPAARGVPRFVTLEGRSFPISQWAEERLSPAEGFIAYDTETRAIEGREVPEMALAAASDGERHVLIHPDDLAAFLKVHHDLTFVFF
jgi:hypothetical protein